MKKFALKQWRCLQWVTTHERRYKVDRLHVRKHDRDQFALMFTDQGQDTWDIVYCQSFAYVHVNVLRTQARLHRCCEIMAVENISRDSN